jgi:hypothetical protein
MRRLKFFPILIFLYSHAMAQGGTTGLSFLRLGVGGRAVGMGEAYSAISTDAAATYYNPSGLVEGQTVDIMVMHKEWVQGMRTEFLGMRVPFGVYAVGLSINTTNIGEIQLRTRPGPAEGTFSSHDFALGISLARSFGSNVSAGITGKFLYEKIFVDEASGAAADFGILYKSPLEGLRFALVGSNFGSMGSLREEKIRLPSSIRVGSAYTHEVEFARSVLTVAADGIKHSHDDKFHLHTGAELNFQETVSFRAGYLFGYESRGFTAGLGLQRDFLRLDYGFSPQAQEINNGHTISVGVEF